MTMADREPTPSLGYSGLRSQCLSFPEILAQSLANIAPTLTPIVNAALVFANAGVGTWLTYVFATAGLVFVGMNINQFARRSASPGSLYAYIARGLGPTVGVITGWALSLAYLLTAMAVMCGFANYGEVLLTPLGLHLSPIVFYAICGGLAWYVAYRDIQLSTVVMLALEVASISVIILLGVMVLSKKGSIIDTAQLTLHGAQPGGLMGGLVLAVFSYVGFESATTLGDEAQHPLRSIPRAVLISTVVSGMFFILMSYIEVLGFQGLPTAMHEVDAPLNVLAQAAGIGFFGLLISVGAMISFFACTLASINAGARIVFAMGRHGIIHPLLGQTHSTHATPHIAVTLAAILTCLPPTAITLCGVRVLDGFGYFGTLATYGFLVTYILISIAAPRYLAREHHLRLRDVLVASAAVLFMVIPAVGSTGLPTGLGVLSALFPVPAAPYHVFPYVFLLYLVVGMGWLLIVRWRSPECMAAMERDIEASHTRFSDMHKV